METSTDVGALSSRASDQTQHTTERLSKIGEVAREFNVSLRTLRFYEGRGLLNPRRNGTARLYSARDRRDLQMILKGRQLGFSLTQIQNLMTSGTTSDGAHAQLDLQPAQIIAQIHHLERQRTAIDIALTELRAKQGTAQ